MSKTFGPPRVAGPKDALARVHLDGRSVGTLHWTRGRTHFTYKDLDPDHPVLGLRFEEDPDTASRPVTGVPVWFANLLPERGSVLRTIYSRQLGRRDVSDFLLLLHLGHDLPGAVCVEPEGELPESLAESLQEAVAHPQPETARMSFSLSGMQLKFSMTADGEGFTLPPAGELGDWIVKLPSSRYADLPANEHTVMTWAAAAGIDVPEHRLVPLTHLHGLPSEYLESGGSAFAVRRFDRVPGLGDGLHQRVHQEDFAQIFDVLPAEKDRGRQELLAQVILTECPAEDFDEYIRRLVLCIAAGNNDEHLKNWTLRYPDTRTPRLSPAYDLVSVTTYPEHRRAPLTLPINAQADMRYLTRDHFHRFARSLTGHGADPVRTLEVVDETVTRLHSTWPTVITDTAPPPTLTTHLTDRLATLPLLKPR